MKRYNKYDLEFNKSKILKKFFINNLNLYTNRSNNKLYNIKIIQSGNYIDLYKYKYMKNKRIDTGLKVYDEIKLDQMIDNFIITIYSNLLFTGFKYVLSNKPPKKKRSNKFKKVILNDNIVRTIYNFRNLVKSNENEFVSFITLTFKDNITDLDQAQLLFKNYIRQVKRYINNNMIEFNLKYICVPEFQKTGRIHYHLLTNIPLNSELIPKRKLKKTYDKYKNIKELYYYDLLYWIYGYSLALDINFIDDLSKYMIMYLVKDKDNRYFGNRKYYATTNLKKPVIIYFNGNDKESLPLINLVQYNKTYERIYTDNKYLNKQLKPILSNYSIQDINKFYNSYQGQVIHYEEFRKGGLNENITMV
jgi:hypothetical protein